MPSNSKKDLSKISISSKRESENHGLRPWVSIIIPSYNEAKTLPKIIEKLLLVKLNLLKELIIVNDGSTDETPEVIKKYSKNRNIKIIVNSRNLGKGASIKKALKQAKGSIILIQDADLEYNPQEIPALLKPFEQNDAMVVYGSRILKKNPESHWTFSLGGKLLTLITNILYGTGITDEATGYKLFKKEVIKNLSLKSKGFEFCPEITAKIAKQKIKIWEVPISYNPRNISEKKIKWWDGFKAIYYLFKYRLTD